MERKRTFVLPDTVYSKRDINQLVRELETLRDTTLKHRERTGASYSEQLQQVMAANTIDGRTPAIPELLRVLSSLQQHAPVIHISFASNPQASLITPIVRWFRQETHQYCLLQIGLQPGIGVGCVVRTPSKYYDMTLRTQFETKRSILEANLRGAHE